MLRTSGITRQSVKVGGAWLLCALSAPTPRVLTLWSTRINVGNVDGREEKKEWTKGPLP